MRTTRDIVIPAGTLLRPSPDQRRGHFEVPIAFGPDFTGYLLVQDHPDAYTSGYLEDGQNSA